MAIEKRGPWWYKKGTNIKLSTDKGTAEAKAGKAAPKKVAPKKETKKSK
tara:strand:- start:316 stop:462 length:147 start_codon:yes stop_codon:yes gene_type:complete